MSAENVTPIYSRVVMALAGNPALIEAQIVEHQKQVTELRALNDELTERNRRLNADNEQLRKERKVLKEALADFALKVVDLDGEPMTLQTIAESDKCRPLCRCRNVECAGCPNNDPADVEVFDGSR